ncbi:MAG TPA: RNA 3'-terminal phosphate cyclase [Fimbriimonadaceae bacterium]|nr:RNA 3'-terminal phosphate cyclase [Fimbriimonadaceae bacterium]
MIKIDGSYGEGGGQIVRTSVALAAITGQACEIVNVRARRSKPGLQPQHLAAVKAAAEISDATVRGGAVGSLFLAFEPTKRAKGGRYVFDIGTAGSATLVAQTVLVPLALSSAPSEVLIHGGTYNPHAPSFEFFEQVYLPALAGMGVRAKALSERAGYYPKGGGEIRLEIEPCSDLQPIHLPVRGPLQSLRATIVTSELPDEVADRGSSTIASSLPRAVLEVRRKPALGAGASVHLTGVYERAAVGFTALGERGKRMERVAEDAIQLYQSFEASAGAVDEHLADQLVLPAALACGPSLWTTAHATEHLRSVLWLVSQFLPVEAALEAGEVPTITMRPNPWTEA